MSDVPKWANLGLPKQDGQVSHGLNLVLELKSSPNRLPQLLWDIFLAQDKIKEALEELSFVHYARFIPSWDGRALMVTTEFSGKLDPYILDFVIALGDVFDTLLSYVEEPPTLPVREHPEEFLVWVRRWNRVPFFLRSELTLFPESFEYPLYSAYPDKTVIDIVGKRVKLPPPALNHPTAAVNAPDVQGNILRSYRAKHGSYLFFRVVDASLARSWLAETLTKPDTVWRGVGSAEAWTCNHPEVLTQVAFTYVGLRQLLAADRSDELERFPNAFREGAAARADSNFDRGESAPSKWIFGMADDTHVVLFLYSKQEPAPDAYRSAVAALSGGQACGLKHLRTIEGKSLGGTEPFGFADGISDPSISGQCPASEPSFQPASSPGEFLLHKDYIGLFGSSSLGQMSEGLACNGSFGVLRLMEQDVGLYKECTTKEAERLGLKPERLRAKLMGRWENGVPLALAPGNNGQASPSNAFDYAPSWEFPKVVDDHDGLLCPVGAHIRRANPRTARVAGQRHARRLLRRGMPSTWKEESGEKVGLMGLFLGASIEHQFEFIQREWLQGDTAASGIRGTTDAISGIRSTPTAFKFLEPNLDCPELPPQEMVVEIPPLVTTRGCLYLFFPGITALKALGAEEASAAAAIVSAAVTGAVAAEHDIKDLTNNLTSTGSRVVNITVKSVSGFRKDLRQATSNVVGGVKSVIAKVVESVSAKQSYLPDVDVARFVTSSPTLTQLLEEPAFAQLANGKWRDIVFDLTELNVNSSWFMRVVDAIIPSTMDVQAPADIEIADFDIADARFLADPYPYLQRLRNDRKPIVWVSGQNACWVLDHAGCASLLKDHSHFVQRPNGTPLRGLVTLDQARHTEVREAYVSAFNAALTAIDGSVDNNNNLIQSIVSQAVESLTSQSYLRQFDFMKDFAHPVARAVIWQFIGITDKGVQKACDALAESVVLNFGKTARPEAAKQLVSSDAAARLAALLSVPLSHAWLLSTVSSTRYTGTLIGELAARMGPALPFPQARPLDFIETLISLVQTVLASQSPHFLLGSAALHLLSPDPRPERLRVTPWFTLAALWDPDNQRPFNEALSKALEETRRCEPPLTILERYAKGEQWICGVRVPDGCAVFAMVASANRDVKYWPQSEEFHFDRDPSAAHLSLGHGIHHCAGSELQAKILPAALGAIIKAMPGLRLSNPCAVPAWRATVYFRVLQALPVTSCPP